MDAIVTAKHVLGSFEVAFVTLFAGLLIAKLVGKVARRLLAEAELNRILVSAGFRPLSDALGTLLEYLLYGVTILTIFQQFGVTRIFFEVFLAVLIVALVLAAGIWFRDLVPNVVAGVFLRKTVKNNVGKKVRIGRVSGVLAECGWTACRVVSDEEYFVPHVYSSKEGITRVRAG